MLGDKNDLQILYLNDNNIGDDGACAVCVGLKYNDTLKTLSLNRNSIGAIGAGEIGLALLGGNNGLQTLYQDDTNIGDDGSGAICVGLKHNDTLVEIHLEGNSIGEDGSSQLRNVLNKPLTT